MENMRRHEVRELARLTSHLTAAQQTFFQAEYGRHRRNPTTALLLCLLLGGFGAHYFYFGRHRDGVVRLLLCWTLIPAIMALFEAHTMAARALRYNASLANELTLALKSAIEETAGQMASLVDAAPAAALATLYTASARPALAASTLAASASSEAAQPADATSSDLGVAADADALAGVAPELVVAAAAAAPLAVSARAESPEHATDPESRLIAAAWAGREPSADDPMESPLPYGEPATASATPAWDDEPLSVDALYSHLAPRAAEAQPAAPASVAAAWPSPLPAPEWHDPSSDIPGETPWQSEVTSAPLYPPSERPAALPPAAEAPAVAADQLPPWLFTDAEPAVPAQALAAAAWQSHSADSFFGDDTDSARTPTPSAPLQDDLDALAGVPVPVAWERQPEPLSGPLGGADADADASVGEPVFMYQVVPQPRRAAVRMGPPPAALFAPPANETLDVLAPKPAPAEPAHLAPATSRPSHSAASNAELAALGSALAAGLAELLRERPRTRPLTRPRPLTTNPLPAPSFVFGEPLAAPAAASLDEPPSAAPMLTPIPAPDPVPAAPTELSADLQQPNHGIRESTAIAPTATYLSTPSRNLRRRVVQRVIVRKMAVLDGHVVAESTVERQVPVIADEAQMTARIRAATTDAAREALQHLIAQAPEDALPAIRMQMDALDSASSDPSFRGAGDHGSPEDASNGRA